MGGGDGAGMPPAVDALLAASLSTMVHVELVLLLHRTAPAAWNAVESAAELHTSRLLVERAFEDLERARLAASVEGASPRTWHLDPHDDRLLAAIAELRELYDRRPVTLIKALYHRPASDPDTLS